MHIRDAKYEPSASCMLSHFAYVGVINITSAFVVVVLLLRIFVAARFLKKRLRGKVFMRETLLTVLFINE